MSHRSGWISATARRACRVVRARVGTDCFQSIEGGAKVWHAVTRSTVLLVRASETPVDRDSVEPHQLTFVLCIEGTAIEQQALMLCESIRRFGGRYGQSPIVAVSPRPDVPIARASRRQLARLGVRHVSVPLNRTGSSYLPINRIVAGAWAEQNLATEYIVILDSDMLLVREPTFYRGDAGARPVDVKGSASAGSDDPLDNYWRRICAFAGIAIDDLPWITATIDQARIRASYNAGFTIVRRACGILGATADTFMASFAADLRPLRDRNLDVRASTGLVSHVASEFWGSSQAALSAAIARHAESLLIYGAEYNIPLHLLAPDDRGAPAWPACDPVLIHYHWLAQPDHHAMLLQRLARLHVSDAVLAWLSERLAQPAQEVSRWRAVSKLWCRLTCVRSSAPASPADRRGGA